MNNHYQSPRPEDRILLVTADENFREWSASALREAGYRADGEGDAEVAWTALCREGYELLVVDQILPGQSGLRLVLRMSHAHLTLPVILVTEEPTPFDLLAHQGLRAVTILPRPFGAEQLIETVLMILQGTESARPVHRSQRLIGSASRSTGVNSTTNRKKPQKVR